MIKNTQQYNAACKRLHHLESAMQKTLEGLDAANACQKTRDRLTSPAVELIEELKQSIATYESTLSSRAFAATSVDQLGECLVKARISRHLTQAELAARLSITQQQVQQYEARCYEQASLSTVHSVLAALELEISTTITLSTMNLHSTVFIIDDDPMVADVIASYFKMNAPNWILFTAHSVQEFQDLISKNIPDLIITDLVMQQNLRAGVEVALLAREATPAATVVIVTGNKDAINTSVFEAAGVNRVIDKFDSHPRACRELLEVALTVLNHETAHS